MGIFDKLMGKSEAGAGRGFVNPKTIAEMEDEKRTPQEREAIQEMKDAKDRAKIKAMGYAKGGMTAKYMSFSKTGKPDGMKEVTKMASGGSASKRADGCCTKGKTKGTMITMKNGGKC